MSSLEPYFRAGKEAGCTPDQMAAFARAGIVLQPRQLRASAAARLCDATDGPTAVGYGGARGGGKSHWLLSQLGADDCQRVPGLKCLLLRKVGKANLEHFDDLRRSLFAALPHTFLAYRGVLTFENGSRIISGHFQSDKDIDGYLGLEYDAIGVEEATTLSSRKIQDITTCCRSSKLTPSGRPWRPRVYSTTNPGGVGHAWYRHKYVDPYIRGLESDTRFIPARVDDNKFNNPEYRSVLASLTGWQRRAWLDGDWDISAGQYFVPFRRDIHVIDDVPSSRDSGSMTLNSQPSTLNSWDDRRAVEWFAALDYGFTHYTVALLGARTSDGTIYVVDEHAQRMWLPARHAAAIKAMLARHGLTPSRLSRFQAGTDIFSRESDGNSIARQYARCGIHLSPAKMDRITGWAEILGRLGDPDSGIPPTLYIHSRCARLAATIPALQHDPNRPEDVLKVDADSNGIGGDDSADALRYLLSVKQSTIGLAIA